MDYIAMIEKVREELLQEVNRGIRRRSRGSLQRLKSGNVHWHGVLQLH